jgi:hypothetical protein
MCHCQGPVQQLLQPTEQLLLKTNAAYPPRLWLNKQNLADLDGMGQGPG